MKNLKNKLFAGVFSLASLGIFGNKDLSAQNSDSLCIKIDKIDMGKTNYMGKPNQKIYAYICNTNERVVYVVCNDYENNYYTGRNIYGGGKNSRFEEFKIDYNTGFIDYRMYLVDTKIVEFKNLTKEQIYQDKEFVERTKIIINACESDAKLRELVKEIYKEQGIIKIPQIKQ